MGRNSIGEPLQVYDQGRLFIKETEDLNRTLAAALRTLSRQELDTLRRLADQARDVSPADLVSDAVEHVADARRAGEDDPLVNVALAEALGGTIQRLVNAWDTLQDDTEYWLRGAIRYFCHTDDEEPDFSSPLGFEDDTEVLNACLRLAGLDDWCINPQDYDDA